MFISPSICFFCRLRILSKAPKRPPKPTLSRKLPIQKTRSFQTSIRVAQSEDRQQTRDTAESSEPTVHPANWTYNTTEDASAFGGKDGLESVEAADELAEDTIEESVVSETIAEEENASEPVDTSPEAIARAARKTYRDHLPQGILNDEQYRIYERLFGAPVSKTEVEEDRRDVLLRDGEDGLLEEVGHMEEETDPIVQETIVDDMLLEYGKDDVEDAAASASHSKADEQLRNDILASIRNQEEIEDQSDLLRSPDDAVTTLEEQEEADAEGKTNDLEINETFDSPRAHTFTQSSRWGTSPSTLPLPRNSMTKPTALLLSKVPNKHLDEAAQKIFGGLGLPYSPSTPAISRTKPQKPVPLSANQYRMTDMEADIFLAAVMPQAYVAITGILVEVRKRLGRAWLENLLTSIDGPRILDAGGGGAGVLAWREVLKAEWRRMHDAESNKSSSETRSGSDSKPSKNIPPTPVGKATVITGSTALRHRASVLLEDTSFLPRLPDYVHAKMPDSAHRKQYDIIIVPYGLWNIQEEHDRRFKILNLWKLLDPNGGILVLMEKGVPRGFEVLADARSYILSSLFTQSESDKVDQNERLDQEEASVDSEGTIETSSSSSKTTLKDTHRAPGQVIAPCPHEFKCPLYLVSGLSQQRKDYCHFSQRYFRPPYLQRMLGAKERNFDDVEFSYVAVRKGVSSNEDPVSTSSPPEAAKDEIASNKLKGEAATLRAFDGYDISDPDTNTPLTPPQTQQKQLPLGTKLPRILSPPLKRQGHVHIDTCTPSGTAERWTVPRSFGKQPYRDARKAKWGDLWPLGAKSRENRAKRLRLGKKYKAELEEEEVLEDEDGVKKGRKKRSTGVTKDVKGRVVVKGSSAKSEESKNEEIIDPFKDVEESDAHPENGGEQQKKTPAQVRREERQMKKKLEKVRGREKARRRRREETKKIVGEKFEENV